MSESDTSRVVVLAHAGDETAVQVAQALATNGRGRDRRPRWFMDAQVNGATHYSGTIERRSGADVLSRTSVEVIVTSQPEAYPQRDFLLRGLAPVGSRRYCPDAVSLSSPRFTVPVSANATIGCQQFGVFDRPIDNGRQYTIDNAANALAALITDQSAWNNRFLSFAGGFASRDWQTVRGWVDEGRLIRLVSACCLNATADRTGIVDRLAPEITDLLVRCARAATSQLSHQIEGWTISTFGPDDYDWLGNLGISKVLLPYMWDAPEAKVRSDLTRNYELIDDLARQLQTKLPFPVRAVQIGQSHADLDLASVIEAGKQRAEMMLPGLLANPPLIFRTIEQDLRRRHPNLSGQLWYEALEQEWRARIEQEALLYLIDTARYGSPADLAPGEPVNVCLGLEVHGGYIKQGNLNCGADGLFLPVAWLPGCVRQHFGAWVLSNNALARERRRLNAQLNVAGH